MQSGTSLLLHIPWTWPISVEHDGDKWIVTCQRLGGIWTENADRQRAIEEMRRLISRAGDSADWPEPRSGWNVVGDPNKKLHVIDLRPGDLRILVGEVVPRNKPIEPNYPDGYFETKTYSPSGFVPNE